MATIRGTAIRDILRGGTAADDIFGFAGNDDLYGNGGNDTLKGGTGNDKLFGGAGNDKLFGEAGIDTLNGDAGDDTLDGGTGNDVMKGGTGNDTYIVNSAADQATDTGGIDTVRSTATYTLGAGIDNLVLLGSLGINGTGNTLSNTITGNAGANTLNGGDGNDKLFGGTGNDKLFGGAGIDTLNGDAGNDTLDGGTGNDIMKGGTGNDTYIVNSTADQATDTGGIDTVRSTANYTLGAGIENLVLLGTALNGTGNTLSNAITGNASANILNGGDGNDTIKGGAGNDIINGGAGTGDTASYANFAGGAGYRIVFDGGSVQVLDDFITVSSEGDDTLNGIEFLSFGNGSQVFRLQTGTVAGETLNGVDTNWNLIFGGGGNDTINASAVAAVNSLVGDAGDDTLNAAGGFNDLWGLEGNDTLNGGGTQDIANYLGTLDKFFLNFDDTTMTIADLDASGAPTLNGGDEGTDTLTGIEFLGFGWGTELYKLTTGDAGANILTGSVDNANIIYSGSGGDTINAANAVFNLAVSGTGDDILNGNIGTDYLFGQEGADTLTGGQGGDFFGFETVNFGLDGIIDFEDGVDMFHLIFLGLTGISDLTINSISATQTEVSLAADLSGLNVITVNHASGATIDAGDFLFL